LYLWKLHGFLAIFGQIAIAFNPHHRIGKKPWVNFDFKRLTYV
jgi:hypothetical protein